MKKSKFTRLLLVTSVCVIACCSSVFAGTKGNYFNGTYKLGVFEGVKGNIECDPVEVTRDVSAWVMLADSTTSGSYIQVGWGKTAGQTQNYHFYQYNGNDGKAFFHYESSVASTGTHSYQIEESDGNWVMKVNGSTIGTVPVSTLGWNVDHAEFFGEIHDDEDDQSPGTLADPISMGYLKVKNTSGSWINATFSVDGVSDLSHQKNNAHSGAYTFEQWDNRY